MNDVCLSVDQAASLFTLGLAAVGSCAVMLAAVSIVWASTVKIPELLR